MCELISWSDEMDGRKSGRRYGFAARGWIIYGAARHRFFKLNWSSDVPRPFSPARNLLSLTWTGKRVCGVSPWRMGLAVPKVKREPKSWKTQRRTHAGILNIDIIHPIPAISRFSWETNTQTQSARRVHNNFTWWMKLHKYLFEIWTVCVAFKRIQSYFDL